MRTANPALNSETFSAFETSSSARAMTLEGTSMKTGILLALLAFSATWTWQLVEGGNPQAVQRAMPWIIGGGIGGFVLAMITIFKKDWAPATAPLYALAEGLVLGGLSALAEARFSGIVFQAVIATFGTLFALLIAYHTGLIRATENFKLGVFAATGGIFMVYLVSFVMGLFGIHVPYIHEAGLIGIGFSAFVVIVAALNLVLDFDFIEQGVAQGAPKYMEWYGAFGLMVTLIWLYMEILRLLSKLRSRD